VREHADALVCLPYQNRLLRCFPPHPLAAQLLTATALSTFPSGLLSLTSTLSWHSNPIAHRVRRKHQRLPPSLLIEDVSDRFFLLHAHFLPETSPIKPSDDTEVKYRERRFSGLMRWNEISTVN
jgi:hypothetical protein